MHDYFSSLVLGDFTWILRASTCNAVANGQCFVYDYIPSVSNWALPSHPKEKQ